MAALRKVLVVDDDLTVTKSFDRVLTRDKGYVVITAQNGTEALTKMRTESYDLVFTDIRMPGMDGVELAEKVKAQQPWLPVVIITGYGSRSNEERARAAGVSEFMHKPLSPEMIVDSAEHALHAAPAAVEAAVAEAPAAAHHLRDVALLLASPFIGLAYALLLPPVGIALLAWYGVLALLRSPTALRTIGMVALLAAAPFVGLVYAVALPLVGFGLLLWQGGAALLRDSPRTRKVVLTALAPLGGLGYAVLLPLFGLGALAWIGGKAAVAHARTA